MPRHRDPARAEQAGGVLKIGPNLRRETGFFAPPHPTAIEERTVFTV
jgi:hypothetical protein